MFDLIIFDLDGVLWISNEAHVNVCRKALESIGFNRDFSTKEVTKYFGLPYKEVLMHLMGDEYSQEKLDRAYEKQQQLLYSETFFDNVTKIDGVNQMIKAIRSRGVKTAVASGNQKKFLDKALNFLGIDNGAFDIVLSTDDVKRSKPDPEMLNRAIEFTGTKPEKSLFIGDAINDVLAAKNASTYSAVVLTGALDIIEAEGLNPDFILESVIDVESILIR